MDVDNGELSPTGSSTGFVLGGVYGRRKKSQTPCTGVVPMQINFYCENSRRMDRQIMSLDELEQMQMHRQSSLYKLFTAGGFTICAQLPRGGLGTIGREQYHGRR